HAARACRLRPGYPTGHGPRDTGITARAACASGKALSRPDVRVGRASARCRAYGLAEVPAQDLRTAGVAELGQGLRLDLPDPLPGDAELPAHLLQRPRVPVGQAEPELDDPLLPLGQFVQDPLELV